MAALFVDMGQGRETGPGTFTYTKPPRAKYECVRCQTLVGPVTGAEAVKRFVLTAASDHWAICPARPNQQGAHAA